jgi:hypothetical protein
MANVGCLGDIVFSVSSEKIETIQNTQWSGSARIQEHQRHLDNSLTEFTGVNADTFSFNIVLSAYLGVNPMKELEKIWDYERKGTALPLVLGEKIYGKYRWLIKSHNASMQNFDGNGNLISCNVSLSLIEYLDK